QSCARREEGLRTHNIDPRPFVWTRDTDLTLRKVQKVAERLAPPENPKRTSDSEHQQVAWTLRPPYVTRRVAETVVLFQRRVATQREKEKRGAKVRPRLVSLG